MNLFLTVGTQLPFDRLVQALDAWAGMHCHEDLAIFGQIGPVSSDGYRPQNFACMSFLEPEEFDRRFADATHIIAHAGMGTIISALVAEKPLLIMPRRARLGEQRNDHQLATVRQFKHRPGIWAVEDETGLASKLDRFLKPKKYPRRNAPELAPATLTDAIRAEILA